jgi:hypothetical protein
MAAPTPKERAYRIHYSILNGYAYVNGVTDGLRWIDDTIDYITNEEEDSEHKPERLEYWNEVRSEYIKIKDR